MAAPRFLEPEPRVAIGVTPAPVPPAYIPHVVKPATITPVPAGDDDLSQAVNRARAARESEISRRLSDVRPAPRQSTRPAAGTPNRMASPGTATAALGLTSMKVMFSPFRFPLWRAGGGGLVSDASVKERLKTLELSKGRYLLTFRVPALPFDTTPFVSWQGERPMTVAGKKVVLEKARYDKADRRLRLQLDIVENPIPLLALIAVAGVGVGLAGWGLSDVVESVDQVVVDTVPLIAVGAVAAVIVGLVWVS